MSRTAKKLSKAEVDILLHDQGVTLNQPFVEGKCVGAAFKDSKGLSFVGTVSGLLYRPRKNHASGASAVWLKEKREFKLRINELEATNNALNDIINDLKETIAGLRNTITVRKDRALQISAENDLLKEENALLKKTLDEAW